MKHLLTGCPGTHCPPARSSFWGLGLFLLLALSIAGCANSTVNDDGSAAIARAMASVRVAEAQAEADPARPSFHFRPPANWMNDPNGTIFADGYLQLFYQHNPYGDRWGNMHWGHARSRDLVHWEQLPIALWPSKALGEEHCFSGTAGTSDGRPLLIYTSVAPSGGRPNEQWAALGTPDWLNWQKYSGNPVLSLDQPDSPQVGRDWRDPFLFKSGERTFMVLGADTKDRAVIPLYEATDGSLLKWKFRGYLFDWPKSEIEFPECPNFFPLGDKWVLILSPYHRLDYWIGSFSPDQGRFEPERHGILDYGEGESANYYASNLAFDSDGTCWLLGWVRGFPEGRGWNGCLALPRKLSLTAEGELIQEPVPGLTGLRGTTETWRRVEVVDLTTLVSDFSKRSGELHVRIEIGKATRAGVRFTGNDGAELSWDGEALRVAGSKLPVAGSAVELHAFLDKSVLEVFADGGKVTASRVVMPTAEASRIDLFSEGGPAVMDVSYWPMEGIWQRPDSEGGSD